MAVFEPYAPCPCGSGQKFKWCCHKVESHAERAQRLFESGQAESGLQALDEGLRQAPGNAWLLTRKAAYQVQLGRYEASKESLKVVLETAPKHLGALHLLTRLVALTETPIEVTHYIQNVISKFSVDETEPLAPLVQLVAEALLIAGQIPAAIRHFELAHSLSGAEGKSDNAPLESVKRDTASSLFLRNPYSLRFPSAQLSPDIRDQFEQAIGWASEGLFSAAASAFELLASDPASAIDAERNAGLCRLWSADTVGAIEVLRRSILLMGETDEAVELEALCQHYDQLESDEKIDEVQLSWPLRDRDLLLKVLRADPSIVEMEPGPLNPNKPDSEEVLRFGLLDRPKIEAKHGLSRQEIPSYVGEAFVGNDVAGVEGHDDERFSALVERFTSLAQNGIRPAHPKTRVIAKTSQAERALTWSWYLPPTLEPLEHYRLNEEQEHDLTINIWPRTKLRLFGNRTPEEAAKAGDAVVPLRAAFLRFETGAPFGSKPDELSQFRARFGLKPEPTLDSEQVKIPEVHLARLQAIPADRLNDDRLIELYERAREYAIPGVLKSTCEAIASRPRLHSEDKVDPFVLYSELAMSAAAEHRIEDAATWVSQGRQADQVEKRAARAPLWDMIEIRIKARTSRPEEWVPDLALVLERYANHREASNALMVCLLEMGLIRVVPKGDGSADYSLDTRPLQALMSHFGPRISTASGMLGVAATKGEIWTPGSQSGSGGGGAIWTPGGSSARSSEAGSGDKPRLILPGQ